MEARALGSTGLTVSRMGIGLAALGRPAYITLGHANDLARDYDIESMRRRTAAVLDAAWEAGIRYVDAARSYGRAEAFLASWLRGRSDTGHPVVGSKWGYEYTGQWRLDADTHEIKEHSVEMFRQQRAESAALLGETLDLYQVHSVTPDSPALHDAALLDALAELRATGVSVGVSLSGPAQGEVLEQVLTVERDGCLLFATVQATWNVLEPSAGPMLRTAHDAGMGVLVKEAVANGRLTPRAPDGRVSEIIGPIASREDTTIDAIALAAVVDQPWADVVLSGAATVEHLRANLDGLAVVLTDDDRAALATLAEPPADYWHHRGTLPWG